MSSVSIPTAQNEPLLPTFGGLNPSRPKPTPKSEKPENLSNTVKTVPDHEAPKIEAPKQETSPPIEDHDPKTREGMMHWLQDNSKTLVKYANYLQSAANGFSFLTKYPFLKPLKDIGDKVGELGTKFFFLVNGAINAFKQLQLKNFTSFIGYLVYVFNGLFVPQNNTYMMNGLGVGLTQWSNQVNNVTHVDKGFKSFADHFQNMIKGTVKIFKESWKNPIKAALDGKPILGATGAFLSLIGFAYWAVTGNKKVGASIRDLGGGIIDAEQILPHQFHFKRKNYITSGLNYLVGTAFDLLSHHVPKYADYFRPLCFLFDGFGRYFQGLSETSNEHGNGHLSKEEAAKLQESFNVKRGIHDANIVENAELKGTEEHALAA